MQLKGSTEKIGSHKISLMMTSNWGKQLIICSQNTRKQNVFNTTKHVVAYQGQRSKTVLGREVTLT